MGPSGDGPAQGECLPAHLWTDRRRKRSYVNQVLARAEIDSRYRPARKLWGRTRNGYYLLYPDLQLRRGEGWQPVYEALKRWTGWTSLKPGHRP
jgi:hypothetical protein